MQVFIGSDHNGFHLRKALVESLRANGYEVIDDSPITYDADDDYPGVAARIVNQMINSADINVRGILLCGSGQGMCMAANRYKGIRACLGYDYESVRSSRNDDDANVLCLPARALERDTANTLVETFLSTPFAGAPRYVRRIREIDML